MDWKVMQPTIGQRLLVLKDYTGLSLAQIAQRGGYAGASSIQKLFRSDYNPAGLPADIAERLARAFVGLGDPPVKEVELAALTGIGEEFEKVIGDFYNDEHVRSKYVELFHAKKVEQFLTSEDGYDFQLFSKSYSTHRMYFDCPDHLKGRQLVAIYCPVGSMWPRIEENDIVVYERRTPPRVGDDVIVSIVSDLNDSAFLLGRLRNIQDEQLHVDVLCPVGRLVIPRRQIRSVQRVMSASDMLPDIHRTL